MQSSRILIVDDSEADAKHLAHLLQREGYAVETARTPATGVAQALAGGVALVVTDLHLSGSSALHLKEGLDVIRQLHAERPQLPVILLTGKPSTETTIEAMKLGAFDYIIKPPDPEQLLPMIEKAVAQSRFLASRAEISDVPAGETPTIIGNSSAMRTVFKQIGQIAATSATVLIRGETGTGKELVANALHQHSDRSEKPFVVVNCPAIPPNLLVSELFGHEAGAYTDAKTRRIGQFEQANGGTIFLDEIGDMPQEAQRQLLRVLQNKTIQRLGGKEMIAVDVRVLAATHRDLELGVVEKEFREDLYHRINVAVIHLPPLRERREDIPDLVDHFLKKFAKELGFQWPAISEEAVEFLQQQTWPGNVRQLQNLIHKAVLAGRGSINLDTLREWLLPRAVTRTDDNAKLADRISDLLSRARRGELDNVEAVVTAEVERELYAQSIRLAEGDQTKAAGWLGISRPTMREKLIRYGLKPARG